MMDMDDFIVECNHYIHLDTMERLPQVEIPIDVFVVWSCKTLQNMKALLANNVAGDESYYEFTYNGDKNEIYVDRYVKQSNVAISEDEFIR